MVAEVMRGTKESWVPSELCIKLLMQALQNSQEVLLDTSPPSFRSNLQSLQFPQSHMTLGWQQVRPYFAN